MPAALCGLGGWSQSARFAESSGKGPGLVHTHRNTFKKAFFCYWPWFIFFSFENLKCPQTNKVIFWRKKSFRWRPEDTMTGHGGQSGAWFRVEMAQKQKWLSSNYSKGKLLFHIILLCIKKHKSVSPREPLVFHIVAEHQGQKSVQERFRLASLRFHLSFHLLHTLANKHAKTSLCKKGKCRRWKKKQK